MSFSDRESVGRKKITTTFLQERGEKSHEGGRTVGSKLTRWRRGGLFVFYASPLPSLPLSRRKGQRERTDESTKSCLIPAFWGLGEEGLLPSRSRLFLLLLLPRPSDARKRKFLRNPDRPSFLPPSFPHPPTCSAVAHLTGGRWSSPPPPLFHGRSREEEDKGGIAREQKPDDWSDPRVRDRFN